MSIKISDSIPAPKPENRQATRKGRPGDGRQETILSLQVGQSFHLKASISSAGVLKWWAKARHPDREFTSEQEGKGTRIWRTK